MFMEEACEDFPSAYPAFPYGYGSRRARGWNDNGTDVFTHQSEFS